jgi:hypothetical protein
MLGSLIFDDQILIRVQEMAVGIIGLCLGMLFAHVVAGSSSGAFALFALLTMAHLACNYKVDAPAVLKSSLLESLTLFHNPGRVQCEANVNQRRKNGRHGKQHAQNARFTAIASVWLQREMSPLALPHVGPVLSSSLAQVSLMAQRAGKGAATQRASLFPTPEDVRGREGIIVCRHARKCACFILSARHKPTPICLMSVMAGSDVVLCSSDCVGSSAADIDIVASGAEFVVFRMAGRVHVAAGRDCAVDALLFAVFVAYCNAAAGWSLPHIFSVTILYVP